MNPDPSIAELRNPTDRFARRRPSLRRGFALAPLAVTFGLSVVSSLVPSSARADEWAPNLTATAVWNTDVTNANRPSDRIGALGLGGDIVASDRFGLGRDDSLHPGFHFAGEWWPRFNGLMTDAGGVQLEWRHKFGLGALAPVFSLDGGVDLVGAKETGRRGTATHVGAALRKRFNDHWRATLSHEYTAHDARYAVFDRRAHETALELGRDFTDVTRLTLRASYRDGDIVSYATPPRPDLAALAPIRLNVETFGSPMVAYSVNARSLALKGAFIRALDESSAVIAAYEWRDTERGALRYVNHLVSLALVHQF
jgi:hypothetical protein